MDSSRRSRSTARAAIHRVPSTDLPGRSSLKDARCVVRWCRPWINTSGTTPHREDTSQSMRPLGVIVLIVLVDLLGFSLVMPLLGPFAEQYGFQRVADRPVVLGVSGLPACGRPDPGPAERSLWPPAAS